MPPTSKKPTREPKRQIQKSRSKLGSGWTADDLLIALPVPIVTIDARSRVTYLNQAATRRIAGAAKGALGRDFKALLGPEAPPLAEVLSRGEPLRWEGVELSLDGALVEVDIVAHPIAGEGDQRGVVAMVIEFGEGRRRGDGDRDPTLQAALSECLQMATSIRDAKLESRLGDSVLSSPHGLVAELGERLNELLDVAIEKDHQVEEYHSRTMDLALGISECFEVLAAVRDGDLSLEIGSDTLTCQDELIANLGQSVNDAVANLRSLAQQAQAIADDNLYDPVLESQIAGDLGGAFARMTANLRNLAEQAEAIANDNLEADILRHSFQGTLGNAFGRMLANLRVLATYADSIASGDLAKVSVAEGSRGGSLGSAFATMVQNLRRQMEQILTTAEDLKASAAEILAVAKQTEASAADEAAAVDETLRTMQNLSESAADIASGAESVLDSAEHSARASQVIGERINMLNAQAVKITDISEIIRGIADKSDILALNASLEGTRAGEVGRGFALVGAEMRRVAETVMDAVRQIKQLSREIQDLSQAAVLASEEGQKLASRAAETAQRIVLTTGQQRTATRQVSQSMTDIQQSTQHSLVGAKQVRITVDDLARTAEGLARLLDRGDEDND